MAKRGYSSNLNLSPGFISLVILLVGMAIGVELVQRKTGLSIAAIANSAPSGARYNLDLVGIPKGKTANMTPGDNQKIFIPLTSDCDIKLREGAYQVTNINCLDGVATVQIPNPAGATSGSVTTYAVWVKALGRPGGASKATECVSDPVSRDLYCSVYTLIQIKTQDQNILTDITDQLLFIYADTAGNDKIKRMALFDDKLKDLYWRYDADGLKLAQLRFYEIPPSVK